MPDQTITLQLSSAQVNQSGTFEILAITAGVGNGWTFSEQALKASLSLWDGAECFIDHAWLSHSIKDLAGICTSPTWDETAKGIRLNLKAIGPAGPILVELGKEILAAETKPDIGFSADLSFTAQARNVQQITRIHSVDLVFDPARGGQFIRSLNSKLRKVFNPMPPEENTNPVGAQHAVPSPMPTPSAAPREDLQTDLAAIRTLMGEAIEDSRKLITELTAGSTVQGPRISGMFNSRDQLQAAVDDMLGAPRDAAAKDFKAHRLTGIRELYMTLTGDYDLHGGYYADRVSLANTADFTGLVKNALNKIVVNTWDQLGKAGYNWWERIVTAEHFTTLQDITGTLVGTVGDLPIVAEGAEYTELAIGDSPEVASFVKYGGYIPLTLELIDRDQTRKLAAYPRELASAGLRKISSLVSAVFTANSGAGPTMADTGALFNATAVTTSGGHANLLTTALVVFSLNSEVI